MGWSPANIRIHFNSPETKIIYLPDAETAHDRVFIRLDKTSERD